MIIWHEQSLYAALNRAQGHTLPYRDYLVLIVLLLVGAFTQHVRAAHVVKHQPRLSSDVAVVIACAAQTGGQR